MDIYSLRTDGYRKWHDKLTPAHQESARLAFLRWASADGVGGKHLNINSEVLSVKIDEGNRAMGIVIDSPKPNSIAVIWFFVGKHSDYEHQMKASRLSATLSHIKEKLPEFRRKIEKGTGLVKAKPPRRDTV